MTRTAEQRAGEDAATAANNQRVLDDQMGRRPEHVASCPQCGAKTAEILGKPVTRCPSCEGQGNPVHTPLHAVKICWYWCPPCNLAYSGQADEYDLERDRREWRRAHPWPLPASAALETFVGIPPGKRARALREALARTVAGVVVPDAPEIDTQARQRQQWEAGQDQRDGGAA